jgi:phage-related protein
MPDSRSFCSARRDLRAFPALVRQLAGFQLRRVQQGLEPADWKPILAIGPALPSRPALTAI